MNNLPMGAYIAFATAIVTATVTLLSVWLTNRGNTDRLIRQLEHERDIKREGIHREKIEEIYILAANYRKLLATYYLPYVRVMEGQLDYNQALDMTIANGRKESPNYDRLEMIIDLYFPSLQNSFRKLLDARDSSNEIMRAHKAEYKKGNLDGRRFVKPMLASLTQMDEIAEEFKNEILSAGRLP